MSLLSFINKSKKVKKLADQSKLFKTPSKLSKSKFKVRPSKYKQLHPKGDRYVDQFSSKEEYNQYLLDFSNLYKKLSGKGIASLRKKIGHNLWDAIKLAARRKGYIKSEDTAKVYSQKPFTPTKAMTKYRNLKTDRREALSDVWNSILKKNKGTLSGVSEFFPIKTIPLLKQKYPKLFAGVENNRAGQRIVSNLRRADGEFRKLEYPSFKKLPKNPEEKLLTDLFPQYTDNPTLVDSIDKQYMVDIWRSRPGQFRTGNFQKDVPNFLTWLRKQEFFNPRNEKTYFRSRGEYDEYALMREGQPKRMHLAHDVPDLVPEGSARFPTQESTPFAGGEAGRTQYLEPGINLKTQPELEQQYIGALADENFDLMNKIDQEMLDKNIRSTIVNPNPRFSDDELVQLFLNRHKVKEKFGLDFEDYLSEDIYIPGGTSDIGFSGGGLVKLLSKLKLTKKQKDLILKTAYSPKRKPSTGPKLTRERRVEKKIRDLYGKEKRWKYVKSKVPGPKSSLQRKAEKECFKHTEVWPDRKKKAAGGILSHYVR